MGAGEGFPEKPEEVVGGGRWEVVTASASERRGGDWAGARVMG